jgi:hypothetical protein
MSILQLPIQKQLDQTISSNTETKQRWNRYIKKVKDKYVFKFNCKDYAITKPQTVREPTATLPPIHNTNKTTEEINFAINHCLQQAQLFANKLATKTKKKPTKEDNTMIEASRNATQAYIVLANKTLVDQGRQKFNKLADI